MGFVCPCMCVCACWGKSGGGLLQVLCCNLHMAQLMSDGERGANSIFFTDGAAPVLVAHCAQLCKSCRVMYRHRDKHIDAHKYIQAHNYLKKKSELLEC